MVKKILVILLGFLVVIGGSSCGGGGGGGGGEGDQTDGDDGGGGGGSEEPFPYADLWSYHNSGSLLYSFVNDNGYKYIFSGVRDSRNVPQYINKLVLTQELDEETSDMFLTVEFDERQRPVKMTLPNALGSLEIRYLSNTEAEVTITDLNGDQQTLTVNHPFQLPTGTENRGVISDSVCDSITGAWEDKTLSVDGTIYGCQNGPVPYVRISGNNRQWEADVIASLTEIGQWYYITHIDTQVPVSYEVWERFCRCNINTNFLLTIGAVNELMDIGTAVGETGLSFIKDIREETVINTFSNALGTLIDSLTHGGTAEAIGQVKDVVASGGALPCTEERYELEFNNIEMDYKAYCKYGDIDESTVVFDPATTLGANFTFVDKCCNHATEAGANVDESHLHYLGRTSGSFVFEYENYGIPDHIKIWYGGTEGSVKIFDSTCRSGGDTVTINYSGDSRMIKVDVDASCEEKGDITKWDYKVSCP